MTTAYKFTEAELGKMVLGGLDVFDFSLCERNIAMVKQAEAEGNSNPLGRMQPHSTGTTIVGSTFEGGVVMGADSRSTAGNIVANKHSMKVHHITDSIFACGAGTAADLHMVSEIIGAELRLYELNSGKKARVVMAVRRIRQYLFQYQGYVGCYYLVGGVDCTGSHIFSVHAHGNAIEKPFDADGSGSLCALAEMETGFRPMMTEEEAKDLVKKGLQAGMHGDNMSGNYYNLVIVTPEGMRREGPFQPDFAKRPNNIELNYTFPEGTTTLLTEPRVIPYAVVEVREEAKDESMIIG